MTAPWPFDPLRPLSFDLIVADPPWLFELRSEKGEGKAPQAQYACMTPAQIMALPVGQLARGDCWLFLWTSAPLLDVGMETLKAWGFTYKTCLAWRKTTPAGKVRMGPGYIARTRHENILVGAIGAPARARAMDSLFDGVAREHSRKPDEFYARAEAFAPRAFKLDLFARQSRPGWATWGNEARKFDQAAE
jgi:N6-adenosine-specific RNA methylase IME4